MWQNNNNKETGSCQPNPDYSRLIVPEVVSQSSAVICGLTVVRVSISLSMTK